MKIQKIFIVMVAMFVSLGALADNPKVSGIIVQQRWPWSRLVDIDYVLECDDPEQSLDIVVEAYNGSERLDIPLSSFSGDLFSVRRGARRIVWDPTMTAYTSHGVLSEFRVKLTPVSVPLYMIVDLNKSTGDEGQIAYVYESDLTNDHWGAWVRNSVTNDGTPVESVVWTGVTTNDIYKTEKLVMRRIQAGTFYAGQGVPPVSFTTVTKDLYAGVFEVTQRQWELITGENPSFFDNPDYFETRPVESVTYDAIRGSMSSIPAVNWPMTDHTVVSHDSFLGLLRAKTGLTDIDLPTSAQWEFFSRAGTTGIFNDGDLLANVTGENSVTNSWLEVLGRYRYNGGFINNGNNLPGKNATSANGTMSVGFYQPNAWGLYDTLGNVIEWCLDWQGDGISGTDPLGAQSGTKRMLRGGSWNARAGSCLISTQGGQVSDYIYMSYGFRVVRNLP